MPILLAAALVASPALAQDAPEPPASADDPSAEDPAPPRDAPDADALARQVARACGDPYAVEELAFTFVVEAGGVEKVRRSHVWRPRDDQLTSSWAGFEASLTSLNPPSGPDLSPQQAEEAWAAFVNDSYWLLAPCKVLDPGVKRSVDEQGRLVLTFEGVGLTPGDRYALTVDPETGRLTRWDFVLQSGREGGSSWEDYVTAGPLTLATRHVNEDGTFEVRFEEVSAE